MMTITDVSKSYRRIVTTLLVVPAITIFSIASGVVPTVAAACPALPTDRGTVTTSISVSSAGTYRFLVRMKTATSSKNTVLMQVDNSLCNIKMGGASLPANTWTWVGYQNGNPASIPQTNLTTGTHTITLAGNIDGVVVDRVIATQNFSCTGDNCIDSVDAVAPTVNITAPANNSTIRSTTNVTANASDNVGVTKVEFYVDNALKATDTNGPYAMSLNPATLAKGPHQLTARAYDAAGNKATSSTIGFTIASIDTTAPTVTITAPANNSRVSGTVAVAVKATDNIGVKKVEFYVDGKLKDTQPTAPNYASSVNTKALSNGNHTVSAKAFDAVGNSSMSPATTLNVQNSATATTGDSTPPTVRITAPRNDSTVSGNLTVNVAANDDSGIKQIQLYVDGKLKFTKNDTPYRITLNTKNLANGKHTVKVIATDNSSKNNTSTSADVTFTVKNARYTAEDINRDGIINTKDFSLLINDYHHKDKQILTSRADINGDGIVNILDLNRLIKAYRNR